MRRIEVITPRSTSALACLRSVLSLVALLLWAGLGAPEVVAAPGFTVTLDRDTISVGENATISLSFTDVEISQPPNLRPVPGLTVGYIGQSQSMTFNGSVSSVVTTYNYSLSPAQPGEYTIPSFSISAKGLKLTSQPVKLKVLKPGEQPPEATGVAKYAFAKLIIPKTELYVGEIMPIEVQIYVQSARDLQSPQLESEGFTFGKFIQPNNSVSRTQRGNEIYNVVVLRSTATAIKPGALTLGPAKCGLTLQIPIAGTRDPFEFFGPRYESKPVTLNSETYPIHVLPLPKEDVPKNFTGAVGNYTMSVSASPTNLSAGDPITLKIRILGQGPLDSLTLPSFDDWHDFKTYPPNQQLETSDPLGLQGAKNFEMVVVPENPSVKLLPPVVFSYFDPVQKKYQTLRSGAVPLNVKSTANTPVQPTVVASSGQNQPNAPQRDIVHIKPFPGTLGTVSGPLIRRGWFIALQGLPILAWVVAILLRRRSDNLANNPRLRRRLEVEKNIQAGLSELRAQATENQAEEFFATTFRLLQEQLGERLDLPPSAITESVIEERLQPAGVNEEVQAQLHELFLTCNQARYAPERSTQELNELLAQVESALAALQSLEVVNR